MRFRGTVLGISFDGLVVSGVVNEFLHLAYTFHSHGYRVLLDLGYEITLAESLGNESLIPPWVKLVKTVGSHQITDYNQALIQDSIASVTAGTPVSQSRFTEVIQRLAELLVATFTQQNVDILIIENGTLPDNPIFTEAIYVSIKEYASRRKLGKFVLWRDWDLMWSTEPHLYGKYPFPGVHKPECSEHIRYAVTTEWMKRRMEAWAPGVSFQVIPSRFFTTAQPTPRAKSLRAAYSIPQDAYLVARCTRVIPQKTVERDLRLLDLIQQRLNAAGDTRKVFLFVSGPTSEDAEEFSRLSSLQRALSIADQVVWGNGLLPLNPLLTETAQGSRRYSIQDLLAESDLSSFLTSYDYEGFGNPPGEAMALGVPFIATTYELYHDVYGSRGALAPLLPIDRSSMPSDPIPETFVDWVLKLLIDPQYRARIIANNFSVCRRFFSLSALERQISELFGL